MDLFDIETHILDLVEHVRHLVPNLAPLVGQPLLNVTDFELRVDKSRTYTEDQLVSLVGMVWKLARFVDDRVHVQQAAGTTRVGYNAFYDYKNYQIHGNQAFSGTKADREFWTHDTMDVEKDILSSKVMPREHHRGVDPVPLLMIVVCFSCPPKPSATGVSVRFIKSAKRLRRRSSQHQASRPIRLRR